MIDKVYEEGEEIGFMIRGCDEFFEFDEELGYWEFKSWRFFEANGCYYDSHM